MRNAFGTSRLDRVGNSPLQGMGKCDQCRRGEHGRCPKRAIDSVTGDRVSCFCADTGHRTDNSWRRIFR